jgi:hypothetical protein
MKITVVTNDKGKIIGTLLSSGGFSDTPGRAGIVAGPGQKIHELNLPESSREEPLSKLHGRSLRMCEGRAELVD